MHRRSPLWFPLVLLLLLAGLTLWIDHVVQPPPPKRDGSARHDPDYKVSNFSAYKTDSAGNQRYVLAATEMLHFPDDDSTELTRPRVTMHSENKPYTQVQAQHGLLSSNGEQVYFRDHVKVVRGASPERGELSMETDYLHVIPNQDFAETDHPVVIRQEPGTVIHANGMEYYKKDAILNLYKGVKVHYVKPPNSSAALMAQKKRVADKQALPPKTPAKPPAANVANAKPAKTKNSLKKPARSAPKPQTTRGANSRRVRSHDETPPSPH